MCLKHIRMKGRENRYFHSPHDGGGGREISERAAKGEAWRSPVAGGFEEDGGGCERGEEGRRGEFIAGFGCLGFACAEIRAGVMDLISRTSRGWWGRPGGALLAFSISPLAHASH